MKKKSESVIKKSLLGILSAGVVLAGSVMPVFADEVEVQGSSLKSVGSFEKVYSLQAPSTVTASNFQSQAASFQFTSGSSGEASTTVGEATLTAVSHSHFNTDATAQQTLTELQTAGKTVPTSADTQMFVYVGTINDSTKLFTPDISFVAGDAKLDETTKQGTPKTVTIYVPSDYKFSYAGAYYYQFHEVQGTTPGTTYNTSTYTIRLVVESQKDGDNITYQINPDKTEITTTAVDQNNETKTVKVNSIENYYGAGELKFTKNIAGTLGDTTQKFIIEVTLNNAAIDSGKPLGNIYASVNASVEDTSATDITTIPDDHLISWNNGETKKFAVTDKTTYTLDNIPAGVTYTVSEYRSDSDTTAQQYEVSYTGTVLEKGKDDTILSPENGSVTAPMGKTQIHTITITNTRDTQLDTGVFTSNLPYFIILLAAAGGLVVFLVSKKHRA